MFVDRGLLLELYRYAELPSSEMRCSGNVRGMFGEGSGKVRGRFGKGSVKVRERFGDFTGLVIFGGTIN